MQNHQFKMALIQAKALDKRADLDGEGDIHLTLSKDSQFPSTLDICKLLRKFFLKKDLILIFNYLIRNMKKEGKK